MRIIESYEGLVELPREQLLIEADIVWPDIACGIGIGTNDDPNAPYLAVMLTFYADDGRQNFTVVFQEAPPLKPLEQTAVDGLTVFAWASKSHTDDCDCDFMKILLDLVANRAYTPIAKVGISQTDHWLDIRLNIGEWDGHHQIALAEFKEKLGL